MRHPGLRRGDAWHRQEEPHPPYPRAGGGPGFRRKPLFAWLWSLRGGYGAGGGVRGVREGGLAFGVT